MVASFIDGGTIVKMCLNLAQLLLTLGLITLGMTSGSLVPGPPELRFACILLFTALALVGLSWPIYRWLHLRPIGLPFCPHCRILCGNYHMSAEVWPTGIIQCPSCKQPIRVCMTRKPPDVEDYIPTLYLRWPAFLGIWREAELPAGRGSEITRDGGPMEVRSSGDPPGKVG